MADHPLFAQQLPDGATRGNLPPLLEALRQVKYDEAENSPEELARNYKDDGNHLFKEKSYRFVTFVLLAETWFMLCELIIDKLGLQQFVHLSKKIPIEEPRQLLASVVFKH